MSEKKTKREKKKKKPEEPEPKKGGILGYFIGGAIGLSILLVLYWASSSNKPARPTELPQLTVMAEFDDLSDPATRADLIRLQEELGEAGVVVQGPKSFPILVPPQRADQAPTAKALDELTREELAAARPYFTVSGWLVPRVYAPDGKSAIFRCYPKKGGRFLSGTRVKVEKILSEFEGSKLTLSPYSKDLRLDDKEDWAKTNLVFGVQSANVHVYSDELKSLNDPKTLQTLTRQARDLEHEHLRSVVGPSSFHEYAKAVYFHKNASGLTLTPEEFEKIDALAKECDIPPLHTEDGTRALFLVSTDAEGQKNLDLCYFLAGNVTEPGTKMVVQR